MIAGAAVRPAVAVAGLLGAATAAALAAYAPLAALVAAVLTAFAVLVITRADVVLLLLVAALPWEDLLAFPTETITVVKILGVLLAAAWLVRALGAGRPLRGSPSLAAAAVFLALVLVSLAASPDPGVGVSMVIRYCLWLAFVFLMLQVVDEIPDVLRVVMVFVASAAAAAGYALVEFLLHGVPRASGPIEEPNVFAALLVPALVFGGYLALNAPRRRLLWALSFIVILAAIFATLSRAALVGLAALALWALFGRVRVKGLFAAAAAVGLVLALAFTLLPSVLDERLTAKSKIADKNAAARLAYWSAAGRMAADHPLLGVGPVRFRDETGTYLFNNPVPLDRPVVHNTYLEILAENGAFALAAFLAILGLAWRDLRIARRGARARQLQEILPLTTAVQGALIAMIAVGLFGSDQASPAPWLLVAIAALLANQLRTATARTPSGTR
jgi:O-antigen ligase